MFSGNALSSKIAGHYFYITKLQRKGLAVMTSGDWPAVKSYITNGNNYDEIQDYLESELSITTYHYTGGSLTSQEAFDLIYYADNTEYKNRESSSANERLIREIQSSKYGCLTSISADDVSSNSVKIYFQKKTHERMDRTVSFKSDTLFTAHPRRKSGARYAFKQSLYSDDGVYVGKTNLTEDNFNSMVSAPLALYFNHNEGIWESSSSFLCSLLEDIDAADIVAPAIPDDLELESSDFYGASNPPNYMGEYTTGMAMPLSVQSNDPSSFGPNIVNYDGKKKVEAIRVVNRTGSLFNKGEIALVQRMDGENILIKIGVGGDIQERPPSFVGPWMFEKFLASSDEYMKLSDGSLVIPGGDEVVDFVYDRCYGTETRTAIPLFQDKIQNQTSDSFPDGQIGLGGNAYKSRINVSVGTEDSPTVAIDSVGTHEIGIFWGPVFPAGFNKDLVSEDGFSSINQFQIPAELGACGPMFDEAGEYSGSPIESNGAVVSAINSTSPLTQLASVCNGVNRNILASGANLRPLDETTVQFSLLSAELYAHKDTNSLNIVDSKLPYDQERFARKFYNNIVPFTGHPAGTDLFGGATFSEKTMVTGKYEHIYDAPLGGYYGPKYDAYVSTSPVDVKGSYDVFGEDGAAAVGLQCGRRLVVKKGAWQLNVDTEQVFGTQGRFWGGAIGGGIAFTVLPLMGGIGWATDTRGLGKSGTTTVWGSALDRIYNFGTAALNVQVWDGWPREDTLWLAQYATPLHFNPTGGDNTETITVKSWDIIDQKMVDTQITVGKIGSPVDHYIPTYGDSVLDGNNEKRVIYNTPKDNTSIPVGPVSNTEDVRPMSEWQVDTVRRSKFITLYGYHYKQKVIGVNAITVTSAGSGFSLNDVIHLNKGLSIKVTQVNAQNGITAAVIADTSDFGGGIRYYDRDDHDFKVLNWTCRGEGFMPTDFPDTLNVKPLRGGKTATISINRGYCWEKPCWDYGPRYRSNLTRCSLPSTTGQFRVWGYKSVQIGVESNMEEPTYRFPGQYEIFTYCHNDIGIHLLNEQGLTTGLQMHNYIKASFS